MRTAVEAFVFAESLCSGSVSDNYATCILNNMRFMPYTKDTNSSLIANSTGLVSNSDLPAISGKTYVDLKPVAVSDIRVRMLQKNDSGQVRFRCLDVFAQPLLPLIDLQDLGLEDGGLTSLTGGSISVSNIIDLDAQEPTVCTDGLNYYTGVPIICLASASTDTVRYYRISYNIRSHIIYLNNLLNQIDTSLMSIKSIIDNNNDYNRLRPLYLEIQEKVTAVVSLKNSIANLKSYSDGLTVYNDFIKLTINSFLANFNVLSINAIEPINTFINENEDWTHFEHYTKIIGVSAAIQELTSNDSYLTSFYITSVLIGLLRVIPLDYNELDNIQRISFENSFGLKYASELYNAINTLFSKIESYSVGTTAIRLTEELARFRIFYLLYDAQLLATFDSVIHSVIWDVIQATFNVFNTGISDFDNYFTFSANPTLDELNTFYSSRGNATISSYTSLYTTIDLHIHTTTSSGSTSSGSTSSGSTSSRSTNPNITEIDLGASFKDNGKYYFANVAYAVGFGTLANIHQIQVDDNIYDTTAITKLDGTVVDQISQSGCTKYRFRQRLFNGVENNSHTQDVEMYIYPGIKDQPFCPTINKYHNMAACTYSGLFTKLIASDNGSIESALFLYKGYEPLKGQVAELIKLGAADINSIDLSLPNLDLNTTDSFIKRQIVALNSSSSLLMDNIITSKDLRYYFKASLVGISAPIEVNSPIQHQGLNVPGAFNLPYLAVIEFIGLSLGKSLKAPTIKILTTAVDSQV